MGGGRSNGGYLGWQWVGSAVVAGSLEGMVMEMGKGTPAAPHPDEGRPVPHLPTILHPPSQVLQGVGRWGARPELKRLNPGGGPVQESTWRNSIHPPLALWTFPNKGQCTFCQT